MTVVPDDVRDDEPDCECPPGMRHEPGCDVVYWPGSMGDDEDEE